MLYLDYRIEIYRKDNEMNNILICQRDLKVACVSNSGTRTTIIFEGQAIPKERVLYEDDVYCAIYYGNGMFSKNPFDFCSEQFLIVEKRYLI